MNDILFLEPIFKERIWGGTRLETEFGYSIPYSHTGECWAISAHPNGDVRIMNGIYQGKTLSELYQDHRELFNNFPADRFPLLTKILDAEADLSVQVHPGDEYAMQHHHELGKNECWYILEADEDSFIIYGHRAQSEEAFRTMVEKREWDQLLVKKQVKKGDFIYVPAGTVHAIGKGLLILETQQSSDTTFRLYDYDRRDPYGNPRDLHIESSILVSTIPNQEEVLNIKEITVGPHKITELMKSLFFEVEKWEIDGVLVQPSDHFLLMSVIEGGGKINGAAIYKGDHFIVTSNVSQIELDGKLELIVSRP